MLVFAADFEVSHMAISEQHPYCAILRVIPYGCIDRLANILQRNPLIIVQA
jgi:hypothetical protein